MERRVDLRPFLLGLFLSTKRNIFFLGGASKRHTFAWLVFDHQAENHFLLGTP